MTLEELAARGDGPAFPQRGISAPSGMSLRDYFAAKAMQAHLSTRYVVFVGEGVKQEAPTSGPYFHLPAADKLTLCKQAYEWADAMLKAREKPDGTL